MRLFIAILFVLNVNIAVAAPSLEEGAPSIAQQRYAVGRELYRAGNIKGAAAEFDTALALFPTSAKLAYNLARCRERLEEPAEAVRLYQRYLELSPQADDRDEVTQLITVLQARVEAKVKPKPAPEPAELIKPEPIEPEPTEEKLVEPEPTKANEVPINSRSKTRSWGIYGVLGGSGTINTKNDKIDVLTSVGAAGFWDIEILKHWRIGARIAFQGGETDKLPRFQKSAQTVTLSGGFWTRYIFPFERFSLYPMLYAGPSVLITNVAGRASQGLGTEVTLGLGADLPFGAFNWSAQLMIQSIEIEALKDDSKANGPSLNLKNIQLTRPLLAIGVIF